MATPERIAALLERLRELAPTGFFERRASELVTRLPDRLRGSLGYLLADDETLSVRGLLAGDKLAVLSDELVDELGKSLTALVAREAERQAAGVRAIVFRPKVAAVTHAPPAGKNDVRPWLERVGAAHLAAERAKPFVRDTLDPRVLVRMPYELSVEDALAAKWGDGTQPSWVLMPVRDAVAKAVAETGGGGPARSRESWPEPPLSPPLRVLFDLLLREHERIAVPTKSLAFRAQIDPTELTLTLSYDHGGRGATLLFGEAHLGLVSFDPGSEAASRKRLVEVALDALTEPDHLLHAPLRRVLEEPAWERTLRRLGAFVRDRKDKGASADRIAFRVFRDEKLEVQPLRQKPMPNGGFSRGSRELGALSEFDPASQERYARFGRALRESSGAFAGPAFAVLPGMPHVVAAGGEPLTVRAGRVRVTALDDPSGITLLVRVGTAAPMPFSVFVRDVWDGERTAVVYDEERLSLDVAEVPAALGRLARVLAAGAATIPHAELPRLEPLLFALAGELPFEWPGSLRGETVEADGRVQLYFVALPRGGEVHLRFRPLETAPDVVPGEGDALVVAERDGRRVSVLRAVNVEREVAHRVARQLGLEGHPESEPWSYVVIDDEPFLDVVLRAREFADADAGAAVVHWRSVERRGVRGRAQRKHLAVSVKSAQSWLTLDGTIEIDGERLALADVLAALRARRRYVKLEDGSFALVEAELRERLAALARATQERDGALTLSPALGHLLEALDDGLGRFEADAAFRAMRERVAELAAHPIALPEGFSGTLRDYQLEGYRWLVRLGTLGIGACLADEMGLGKTIQALALLLERAHHGPALVIAPTSVGMNWVAEAARFVPSLGVSLYRGKERGTLLEGAGPGTVLVTSYDIATLDVERLAKIGWATLVLDEAQMLKNAGTQRGRAVRRLGASTRVALTGTPLENHLGELWSLFDVLTPGLFGTEEEFRERFARPIEVDADGAAHEALRALVKPFILRRRKADVAPELPPRTEVLQPVELSEAERALYEAERSAGLEALLRPDAGAPGPDGEAFRILAVISRLRQLACHPRLVHPEASAPSSKLAALLEVLEQVEREGGRALVFSEWTRLLALVEAALSARRVPYLYLDGETPALERAARVTRFQNGEGKVFLLSLRAGGTGLNLTGADWVIHLDPWWNPAVEDQATDRAHRIGQTKPVTVVRLVAQGTIEEAVMGLHAHKRALATGVLEGTEAAGKLGVGELMELLSGVESAHAEAKKRRSGRPRAAE
jgi:superfamily II DNA or RNA helicase